MARVIRLSFSIMLFFVFTVIGSPGRGDAAETVLIVQSVEIPLYEEVVKGFTTACCQLKIERFVVRDQTLSDVVRKVQEVKPALIVTIGLGALKKVKQIETVPIIYSMVLASPNNALISGANITGVSMNIPQEQQLDTFVTALPEVKTIGIVYDPKRTARLVDQAATAAKELGVVLMAQPVNSAKEVAPALEQMGPAVDAIWMLPDLTVITNVTIEYMFSFSVANRIPLLTFSDKYVEQGALMSVSIDTTDIGVQTGELATAVVSGTPVKNVPPQEARKGVPFINVKVAKKLNIAIDKKIVDSAMKIN